MHIKMAIITSIVVIFFCSPALAQAPAQINTTTGAPVSKVKFSVKHHLAFKWGQRIRKVGDFVLPIIEFSGNLMTTIAYFSKR